MTELRDALEVMAEHERHGGLRRKGYEYGGRHDFVLREGTWYEAPTTPHRFPQGAPRQCFGNAINGAVLFGLAYVEGIATSRIVPGLPIHHAWNIDPRDGSVIDLTWGEYLHGAMIQPVGNEYVGVEFAVERADDATWEGDATILDDWQRDWPILRGKWTGEDPEREWPASPRLELLRMTRDGADRAVRERMLAAIEAEL